MTVILPWCFVDFLSDLSVIKNGGAATEGFSSTLGESEEVKKSRIVSNSSTVKNYREQWGFWGACEGFRLLSTVIRFLLSPLSHFSKQKQYRV